jgi:hypothetical protein
MTIANTHRAQAETAEAHGDVVNHFETIFNRTLADNAHLSRQVIVEALATQVAAWIENYDAFVA